MAAFNPGLVARSLTGSFDIRTFNEEIRERRAQRFAAAIAAEQLAQLFDLARLEGLFAAEAIPLSHVDLYEDGHLKRLADMQKKSGKTGLAVIAESFRAGATIRLREVDSFDLRLSEFISDVRRHFAAQSQVNVYLTPPATAGFPPHFDITDVFIVQTLGAKEWRVFDGYTNRVDLPLIDTNWEPDRFTPSTSAATMCLSAGDVLYLPRGVMHQAHCTDRASMHLTISLTPLTFVDVISRELQRVAATDIEFRRRVPWAMDDGDSVSDERIAGIARDCVAKLAKELDVPGVIATERRSRQAGGGNPEPASFDLRAALGSLFEGRVD